MSDNCFWLNYNEVFRWRMNYLDSATSLGESENTWNAADDVQTCMSHLSIFSKDGHGKAQNYSNVPESLNEEDVNDESEPEQEDPEFEVSEEWVRHIEERIRMRAERAAIADEKKDSEQAVKDTVGGSTTRDDYEKRMAEMKTLYGSSASMIIGMETAVQLTFNRNVDLYNPSYWPILPFTFKFAK